MNKIFKVVWNRTIGSFVVTSELAKGRVKSSSEGAEGDVRASEEGRLKTLFRLTALSAALFGLSESAWAHPIINSGGGQVVTGGASETAINGGSARGVGSVAVGAFAKAGTRIEADGAIAIGGSQASTGAYADGNNAIAIGQASNANAAKAISIGSDTIASHEWTSAYGGRAEAKNLGATALGSWTQASGQFSIAVGGSDGNGRNNGAATIASGDRSTAIGRNAKSAGADTIALGTGTQANDSDAVAVGTGAQATLANSIAIGKNSVATGVFASDRKGRAIAVGFNTQALGEDSVAIGSGVDANAAALAQNRQSVALGWQARATGTTQAVAIGPDARASGAQSTSIGNNTRATGASSIAIGGDDWDDAKKSVNAQYKVLTGSDMSGGYQSTTATTAAVAVGVKAQATGALSTAFGPGTIASGLGASAFGVGASATQDKSVAIGAGSHTNTDATAVTTATVNGITYGGFAGTTHITSGSQVSFGSAGYERQLKHVAPGAITATSTDAINGSQLYALHAGSGNIAKAVADALGGGAAVGIDPTNNQGTVTLPSYDVLKGSDTPNTAGNGTAKFNTTPAKNVAAAMTNLNTYVNQGFAVKDNAGDAKGIVTPGESVQFADGNATTVTVDTEANGNTKIKYDVKVDDSTIKVVDGKLTGASQTHFYSVNSTDKTKANYNNDGATGENAIAAGPEAKAAANNAVVMGNKATVEAAAGSDPDVNGETTGESSVAVGSESTASGKNAVAIGQQANAYGENTFAGGQGAKALGKSSVAVGEGAKANERNTIAIGSGNNAWKIDSIALGRAANADGAASLALGLSSHTREANAIALGNNANADDTNSIAIGTNSKAAQAAAVAIGNNATALKYSSVVIGEEAKSNNSRSVVIGYYASATNPAMSASNQDTNQTVAIGAYANAWGDQSTAIGNNVDAKGNSSIAIGADDWDTVAVKTVEGTGKTVKEVYQDYTGDVMETGSYTHTTSSEAAVAIGTKSQAIGQLSTAFGTGTIAEGVASAAFGMGAKATKGNSVAIGAGSTTTTDAIEVNEATVNNLKYSGFAGGNRITSGDQVSFGSSGYERQLKNVAPGEISNTSTDAINGSQLYAVQNVLGNTAQTVKDVLGGNAKLAEDGSITMSNIGNTGAGNIHDAIKSVKETAEKGWKLKANDEADSESEKIAAGDTVTVKQGKNIRVKRSSKELTIETADDVAFNKVTVGNSVLTTDGLNTPQVTAGDSVLGNNGLTIANGANPVSLTKSGLDNGGNKVTNIADGVADTDAASYKQVKAAKTEVQKGTNVVSVDKTEGTDGHAIYTVNAKGTAVSAEGTENGLKLTSSEDSTTNVTTYNLDLSDKTKDSLKKADSALQGIDVKVNDENVKTLTKDDSTLKFVNGTGTTAENKGGTVTFNVNKSTLTTGAGGVVSADTAGDAFATAADVAKAINKAVVDSEKTSVVAAGDNTHVAAVEAGNQTTYTVHADNTTVSVKDGGKLALKSSEATNSNHTKTTNYELDLSDDAKAEIQKGVDAKNIVDTKGITFSGNSGSPVTKKLDETLAIKGDDTNVVTESGTDGITVKLKDEITVQTVNADKLKAGDSVLTNDGLNIANGNNPVSLTKSGLNNGGNKITKVAKGENEDDAVNYAQLKELAEKGLTFDADGNTSTSSKKLGERVGIKGGNNITTSADSDNVTVKLNDDITLNSVTATTLKAGNSELTTTGLTTPQVTAGDSVLGNNGLTIANGATNAPVSLTKSGLDNGGNKVTNVAKGTADTDAVNFSQLNPIAKALNTTVNPDGSIAAPNFTVKHADGTEGTPVHTVQDALDKVGEEVTKGINVGGTTGSNKYALGGTINIKGDNNIVSDTVEGGVQLKLADTVKIGQDSGKPVSIDGTAGTVSGLSNTTLGNTPLADSNKAATEAQLDATQVNLKNILGGEAKNENGNVSTEDIGGTGENTIHDAIKSVKATADKGWKLKANDEADSDSEKIAAGDTVTVKQGKNIRVKRSGKDLTIETEDDVAFNKVTVGNSVLTTDGLTTPQVTAGDSVLGNNGLTIANGTAGSPVSLTKDGLNNGGNKVTNVAKGTADTDAVNFSQLNPIAKALNTTVNPDGSIAAPNFTVKHADGTEGTPVHTVQDALDKVGEEVTKGINVGGTTGSNKYALGGTINIKGDSNIVSDTVEGGVQLKLADTVKIGQDSGKPVSIDGTAGTVSGLSNTTLGAAPLAGSNKAATEAQLDATQVNLKNILGGEAKNENGNVSTEDIGGTGENNIHDAIKSVKATADKGWKLKANDEADSDSEKIAAGDTVTVKQGKNIRVKRSGKDLTIETEDDVAFNKVTVGNSVLTTDGLTTPQVTAGDSVLGNNGLTIANGTAGSPVSLTKDGLNNGGNKVTDVAKGTADTDGVNVSQLNPIAKALNTTVNPDGSIAAPNFTVKHADGTEGTPVHTVQDALDKVGEEVTKGINVGGTTGSNKYALGGTINIKGDSNIVSDTVEGGVQLKLADTVKIGQDSGKPVSIDGTAGTVSGLSNTTLGNTPLADSNKAATEAQLDATQVNLKNILGGEAKNENGNVSTEDIGGTGENNVHDAIKSVKATADKGWKLKANDEADSESEKIAAGDTVTVKQGKNIRVKRSGKDLTIETEDDVAFNKVTVGNSELTTTGLTTPKVTAGDSVLTTDGLNIANGAAGSPVSLTKDGLNNGGNKVTNVAKGTADTDGVNVSQLNPVAKALNTTVNPDGSIAAPNFTVKHADGTEGTPVHTVQDALDKVGEEVTKGINVGGTTGSNKYALGGTINIKGDSNIVSDTVEGGVQLKLADTVKIGQDSGKPVSIDGTAGTVSGLSNTTLGNTPLADSNKAATEAQLDATQVNLKNILGGEAKNENGNVSTEDIGGTGENNVHDAIKSVKATADKGWKLKANDEADSESEKIAAGDTVTVKQGKNIRVKRSGKDLTIETEDDVAFNKVTVGNSELTTTGLTTPKVTAGDSVLTTDGLNIANGAAGSPVSLTKDGLNNGGNKVTNVAKGTADTDGVNVSQLNPVAKALNTNIDPTTGEVAAPSFTVTKADGTKHPAVGTVQDALDKVGEEVTKGLNIVADNGSSEKVNLGDTVKYTSKDKNIVTTSGTGKEIDFSLAEKVTIGKDAANGGKPVVIDGKEGIVSGLTNTTLGAAPLADSNKAATEAQLDATQVNLKNILGGEAKNENGNVSTEDIGGTGESNVHDAIKSVKATADKGWKLKANDEADSESEKIAAGDTVTVKQGKNIRVKRSGKDLTIETEDDVAFNKVTVGNSELTTTGLTTPKVTAGDSVLTTDGLNIANGAAGSPVSLTKDGLNNGGNKVTNVAKGTADTDGVNVSQLNPVAKALNTNIDPTTGEVAAPSFTVTKADGTKHPAVGTVQDALDKVGEEVTKGLNIVADNGSSEKVNLGDTVKYTSKDKNIVTTSGTGKEIDFSLAEKVTIGKDAANGGKPVVIDGKEGIVSGLTNTTLGAAPLADSNKAATEAQLDATQVNLANVLGGNAANNNGNVTTSDIGGTGESNVHDAIKSVKATADKGWKLKANDEADSDSEKIAAGDTVTVKQGKNIRVKRSGKDLTIETADDVAFNKVTVGNSVLTTDGLTTPQVTAGDSVLGNNGLTIANGTAGSPVSLTKDGLNNGGNKVTDVAKGTADTDAVNVSQLNPVAKALNTNIDPTTGEVAAPSFTVTKADGTKHPAVGTVQDALDKVGEEVTKGLNIVADNGSSEKVNLGDTVKYTSKDKNIVTTSGTGKEIDFSLAEKVTIGKDAANGGKPVVIDGKEGIVSGLTNTTLGAAPLADSNKAATEAQLDATQVNLANVLGGNAANNNGNVTTSDIGGTGESNVHDAIKSVKATADKGWNLNANDETSSEKIGAGDTVTFKEGKNVKVSRNGKSITIATSDDVSFKTVTVGDSVLTDNGLTVGNGKAGKPVSLTKDGLNNGGNKIANVAAGEADTDAVNVAQLKAAAAKATSKVESGNDNIVVAPEQNADGSTTYKVATAPNLKADSFTAGDTVVNKDGVKVGDKVALGRDGLKAGDVNITADGINAGNKAISNVAEGKKDTDAVNVAQLKAAAAKATSKVESGNDNIVVTPEQNADGSTTYKVATAPDLKADSLTTGDTVVNNDGVKVGDKVALTKDGLDNGGNKVANVAAGEADTDAVNVAQLKAAAAKATSKVESGNDNIVVTPEQNADGSTTYKVATAPDLKADSLTTGDTVVNNDGVKVGDKVALGKDGLKAGDVNITADGINAGNKAISNVAEGKKDTDAVNVGQLNRLTAAAKTEVEAGTNIASVSSKQGANKQTVYTINADGASVSAGSDKIVVTKGKKDANNVTDYAVDLSKAVKDDIAKGVAAKDAVDNKGISFAGDSGTTVANKLGDTVAVKGDANITTTAGANGIQVGLNKDLKVDSVTTGGVTVNAQGISIGAPTAYNPANTVSLSPNGLNNGGQRITNVAPAKEGTDAVNLNQLVGMGNALQNNIANVGKKAYAGVAGAIAQGSIPQVTRPGATGIGVGSGYYGGQSAMAIGVSAMSDGGNWIVKGNFSANTDGHVGVGAGALYQW